MSLKPWRCANDKRFAEKASATLLPVVASRVAAKLLTNNNAADVAGFGLSRVACLKRGPIGFVSQPLAGF
jgi:hypothetical protein